MPGEYIEIRTFFLSGIELSDFLEAGFKINKIQSQKIDADAYCDILLYKTDYKWKYKEKLSPYFP